MIYVACIAVLVATGLPLWIGLLCIALRMLIARAEKQERALARLP